MSSRAVARLALGCLAAAGALTLAVHLAEEPSATGTAAAPATSVALPPKYDVAPAVTMTGARAVLESTLSRPLPTPSDDYSAPIPLPVGSTRGLVPGGRELGQLHLDPVPEGASLADPTDTASLYERAGLPPALAVQADEAAAAGEPVPAADVPPGDPSITGLTEHVEPSCSGTGTDGKRVQVLYVRESTTASRFAGVVPLLRNEVANVDDTFALSAEQTGGERRVRWVHDAACLPVIKEVVVPAGTLDTGIGNLIAALQNQGYTDKNRKYLAFADASKICGVGTLYLDTSTSGNWNDGAAASYSRVDAPCWSYAGHSVAAHELTHNLGAVQPSAPHATTNYHCSDESDLMCYDDGSGIAMKKVCASAEEQLLDCNGDDYFNTAPPAGSYLAKSWNTASSGFLDTLPGTLPPTVAVTPSTADAETGDTVSLAATSDRTVSYRWVASQPCSLTGQKSAQVSVLCPSSVSGPVTMTVTVTDSGGRTANASATLSLTRAAAPTGSVTAPATAAPGDSFPVSAEVTGKAPFTYAWTTTGPCGLSSTTSPQPWLTCPTGSTGQSATVSLTVTQADGQPAAAAPATVTLSDQAPTTDSVTNDGWTTPVLILRDPAVLGASLNDDVSGTPVVGVTVELQARSDSGQPWQTLTTGLATDVAGQASAMVQRTSGRWYRFAWAGDPGTGAAPSTSESVFLRGATTANAAWRGSRNLVTGRLLRADGTPVASATVVLQKRRAGSTSWVTVTQRTTGSDGRVAVKQRPRRATYFRWVFAGNQSLLACRSSAVRAR